ncbi:MAG: C2 family cysteine protease [Candidatus Sericytochromatia bacterium]
MEFNTINSLQKISGKDGHITSTELKKIDENNDGCISSEEAQKSNIDSKDLSELNKLYSSHNSNPNKVIFSKEALEAKKQQKFVENNFKSIDSDKDGFLSKKELSQALQNNNFSKEDKEIISKLKSNIEDLEEYSNDEWFDENDGITLKDMNAFVKEVEKNNKNITRSDKSIFASELTDFVKNNFAKFDTNKDGFISKGELDKLIHSPNIKGQDAVNISTLRKTIETIEEISNDEWFDENDGITLKDIEGFLNKAEKNSNDKDVSSIINSYNVSMSRLNNINHDLYSNKANPLESIKTRNMAQGSIGDCFFLSAVASVVERNPQEIKDMIKDNNNGTYTVKFPGADKEVTVQPPTDSEIIMYGTSGQDGMWLTLLEKAYAKLRNDSGIFGKNDNPHDTIDGGDFQDASIKLLTAHKVDTDYLPLTSKDTMRKKLMTALNPDDGRTKIVTASTFMDGDNSKNMMPNHVFSILSYDPKTDTVRVRNPWGNGSDATGIKNKDPNNDGTFTLTIDELDDYFNLLAFEESSPIDNYDHLKNRYLYKLIP